MAWTVASRSVTTPLRIPVEGDSPTPMISSPSGPDAAMTAHVFVVPMSRPAIVSPLAIRPRLHFYHDILWFETRSPTTSSTWAPPIPSTGPAENSPKLDRRRPRRAQVDRTDRPLRPDPGPDWLDQGGLLGQVGVIAEF